MTAHSTTGPRSRRTVEEYVRGWTCLRLKKELQTSSFTRDVVPHLAVFPAKKKKRITRIHDYVFDFRNEDRMVASVLGGVEAALEIRQRAVQDRRALGRAVETRSGFGLGAFVRAFGTGVVIGDGALVLTEDVDPKTLLGVEMRVGTGGTVDAEQHQQRIERYRSKGICGHAVDLSV